MYNWIFVLFTKYLLHVSLSHPQGEPLSLLKTRYLRIDRRSSQDYPTDPDIKKKKEHILPQHWNNRSSRCLPRSVNTLSTRVFNSHNRTVQQRLNVIKILFIHQLMHYWVVLKTIWKFILKFTLKQVLNVSVRFNLHQRPHSFVHELLLIIRERTNSCMN